LIDARENYRLDITKAIATSITIHKPGTIENELMGLQKYHRLLDIVDTVDNVDT